MAKHKDPRPTHHKIAAQLRAEILSGRRKLGSQLPITSELITQFGVANQTIQRALTLLKEEGLLIGRSGRGVFVRDEPLQMFDSVQTMYPGEQFGWIEQAARKSKRGSYKILDVAEVEPPAPVREALGLHPGETAAMRYRLGLLDDEPSEIVRSYYPMDLARGTALLERKRIKGGTPKLLADMGYEPREMVDNPTARPATEEEFTLLELPAEVPLLCVFRVVYSDDQKPIEVTDMVKASHVSGLLYRVQL